MSSSETRQPGQHPPYIDESLIINTRLKEIERRQEEEKAEEKAYKRRQLSFNRLTVIFTGLLFVTSGISDWILLRQTRAARIGAEAAKSAAETAQKTLKASDEQLEATTAAIISLYQSVGCSPCTLDMAIQNGGHGIAPKADATLTLTVETVRGRQPIGKTISFSIPSQPIPARLPNGNGGGEVSKRFVLPAFIQDVWDNAGRMDTTIRVESVLNYDNGFGKSYSIPRCQLLLVMNWAADAVHKVESYPNGTGLVDCQEFQGRMDESLRIKRLVEAGYRKDIEAAQKRTQ